MEDEHTPAAEQVGGGEAALGDAQAANPAPDDEMIDEPSEGEEGGGESGTAEEYSGGLGDDGAEGGTESYGGDQDAEPTAAPDEVLDDSERDQAEG